MANRVLVVHNAYQNRGGEDTVVEAEVSLLRSRGHEVETFFKHNSSIEEISHVALACQTIWSRATANDVARLIDSHQPDVIHAHNTFPLISPSLYWAAAKAGVPVVQTLHNFRLLCLNAMFLRDGKPCEDCLGAIPLKGVARACYRESRSASAGLAGMLTFHRGLGTYRTKVSRYIALNEFCRQKFIDGGIPAARIAIKPNFVDLPPPEGKPRHGLLFVGRLAREKGISTLAAACSSSVVPVRVAGSGPEAHLLPGIDGLAVLGDLPAASVRAEMNSALALVVPSIWYENSPRTIVEAYATGLPVIASRIGALQSIVRDGETGMLFEPGDSNDLAQKMTWASQHPKEMAAMGRKARELYEREYSPDVNYRQLAAIYDEAIGNYGRIESRVET